MIRSLMFFLLLMVAVSTLTACAQPATTDAPVRDPRESLPLPPQPTSAPETARPGVPFVSPTFAPVIVTTPVSPGTPPTVNPTPILPTSTPTRVVATPTPAATPTRAPGAATPTPGGARAEVKFDFNPPLATAELIDDVAEKMKEVNGIIAVSGNEISVTLVYDPTVITPEQIRQRLAGIGRPVR